MVAHLKHQEINRIYEQRVNRNCNEARAKWFWLQAERMQRMQNLVSFERFKRITVLPSVH